MQLQRLIAAAAIVFTLPACANTDGRPDEAFASDGEQVDSAELARLERERVTADSIAEWDARFGSRVARPDSVRALYVNGWAAGSRSRMAELIRIADETEINAFVIDIKESDTYLVYDSTEIELAREIGADERPGSRWMPELIDSLEAHGIYPIARIVVFKDRMLAEKRPELAIADVDGGTWLDQKGMPWVNPYDRRVWDYNIAIAREALDMGFSEVQWDYVRFPDVVQRLRATMAFPGSEGRSQEDNIRDFIAYSQEQLAEYQVPIAADVFGLVTHLDSDVGIGQRWEKVTKVTDALLPMVYPSHYAPGSYGIARPNASPYQVVRSAMEDAVARNAWVEKDGGSTAEVMPWLEAMTATWVKPTVEYGPEHLRAQIQAAYDAGLKSWTLWNPGSRYEVFLDALRPADGALSSVETSGWRAPDWDPSPGRLSVVVQRREEQERLRIAADSARADSLAAAGPRPGG